VLVRGKNFSVNVCHLWNVSGIVCADRTFTRRIRARDSLFGYAFRAGDSRVYQEIFSRLREIDNRMSVNIAASDVSRVNAAAGIEPVQVHDDVFFVIERAVFYARLSNGAFDPSVGPLVSLWGIGSEIPAFQHKRKLIKLCRL